MTLCKQSCQDAFKIHGSIHCGFIFSAPPAQHVEIPLFEAMVKNGGPGQQPAKEHFLVELVYFDNCYSVDECYFDDCWVVFVGQHLPSVDSLSVPCHLLKLAGKSQASSESKSKRDNHSPQNRSEVASWQHLISSCGFDVC
jgi:hypothetical protein